MTLLRNLGRFHLVILHLPIGALLILDYFASYRPYGKKSHQGQLRTLVMFRSELCIRCGKRLESHP